MGELVNYVSLMIDCDEFEYNTEIFKGFQFLIKSKDKDSVKKFVEETLDNLKIPYKNIRFYGSYDFPDNEQYSSSNEEIAESLQHVASFMDLDSHKGKC